MAEPLYLALQKAGFEGDAHKFVKNKLLPRATSEKPLIVVLEEIAKESQDLRKIVNQIPEETRLRLRSAKGYIGLAVEKALDIVERAKNIK